MAKNERNAEIFGPFEVLESLGVGAMATVHRGIERGINGFERVVAIKRLLPHLVEDEEFVRAFVREAKLASMLHHGNIVQLYELGRVGASYFISMEYIRGRDLRVILRQARRVSGPPPVEVTIALMTQLLDALDYAHGLVDADGNSLGLIHRDISPPNLIISNTGHVKVIDFGIAKASFGHLMTHSGRIKGKLAYMAPETLSGRQLDGRSDLFSASIIAHELLTATPLFAARDDFQIIDRLQNMQVPPPSARNPSCPVELDQIILRGLAKDPDKRWRSAAEMRAAISQFAVDHRVVVTNREVVSWMEEAFQRHPPAASARLRLPLAPPPTAAGETSEDDLMEMVWGTAHRSNPVILDEVPDVSSKLPSPGALPAGGDGSNVVHRSDGSIILVSAAPVIDRNGESSRPGITVPGAGGSTLPGVAPLSPLWATTQPQVTVPAALRATSGAPVTPTQQPQGMLEEAMQAAQRAEALALAAMASRRRRAMIPFVMAAVAVSAAGAGLALLLKARRPPAVASADGEGAQAAPGGPGGDAPQVPAAAVQGAALQPERPNRSGAATAAPAGQAGAPAEPGATSASAPVATPIPPDEEKPAQRTDAREARSDEREDDRDNDRRSRRARSKRERAERRSDRDRKSDDEKLEAESDDERASESEVDETPPAEETAPAPPSPSTSRTTIAAIESAPERNRDAPLAVAVEPPAPAAAAPRSAGRGAPGPRTSGPIIVSADRAQRASGNLHPIRFPHGEQLPPRITAKLCVDPEGSVTSVTVLSSVSAKVRSTVERELSLWRYKPVMDGSTKVAACFATAFPVQQVD